MTQVPESIESPIEVTEEKNVEDQVLMEEQVVRDEEEKEPEPSKPTPLYHGPSL